MDSSSGRRKRNFFFSSAAAAAASSHPLMNRVCDRRALGQNVKWKRAEEEGERKWRRFPGRMSHNIAGPYSRWRHQKTSRPTYGGEERDRGGGGASVSLCVYKYIHGVEWDGTNERKEMDDSVK